MGDDDRNSYTKYTLSYFWFTFENTLKSLIIKDSDDSIDIDCHYNGDVIYEKDKNNQFSYVDYAELQNSWNNKTQTVYLGRNLIYDEKKFLEQAPKLNLPNLKSLTIGPKISDVSRSLSFGESLIFLKSLNLTPPKLSHEFTQFQYLYLYMEVEVPEESLVIVSYSDGSTKKIIQK